MENYKEASRLKLRFNTTKGSLTTEHLWDLSITELDTLAVALEAEYKESGKKSFVVKKSSKDKVTKLKFDIVLDILTTKVEEAEEAGKAKEDKERREKILSIIARKKEASLEEMDISELEKML